MKKAIIAKKLGMTQIFGENGELIPVTVLEAGPCTVIQKKSVENDGYKALCVSFGAIRPKKVNKPFKGQFEKAGLAPARYVRELKLDDCDSYNVGGIIKADMFSGGDMVDITGVSKGKGFQGAIRRYSQHRGPMSHGSKYHRGLGSLGSGTTPGRVKKGKHMPGHMGSERITVQNLLVVRADAEKNLILVRGPVPGANGALLMIKDTVKN